MMEKLKFERKLSEYRRQSKQIEADARLIAAAPAAAVEPQALAEGRFVNKLNSKNLNYRMTVLSLFDGMSCGRIALRESGMDGGGDQAYPFILGRNTLTKNLRIMGHRKTKAETSPVCDWLDNPIHTGIVDPDTGKEFILSGYYEDETGNRHFTHQQAQEIADRTPGWELCTDKFHQILADTVWDDKAWEWKEDVLGTGMNGLEYLTRKLKYELGGYRGTASGALSDVGNHGYSWSSAVAASGYTARNLGFSTQGLYPTYTYYRANGLQVRCLLKN